MVKDIKIIEKLSNEVNLKSILDLGCGNGRLTNCLVKKGIRVTGIDLENRSYNNNINFIKSDIRDYKINQNYDLVISSCVLHFMKKDEAINTINKMKKNTSKGGYNLLVCMSELEESKMKHYRFYPSKKELINLYKDWKIENISQSYTDWQEHDGLPIHRHNIIVFLAKNKLN
jgi:tellurite methyltransferase